MKTVIGIAPKLPEGSFVLTEKGGLAPDVITYLAPDGHLYREYVQGNCVYLTSYCHVLRQYEAGYLVSEGTFDFEKALEYLRANEGA